MGLAFMLSTFAVVLATVFAITYSLMRLSCFIENRYTQTKNKADLYWIENIAFHILLIFMCESCKESCEYHHKLVARSFAIALFVALVALPTAYIIYQFLAH